MITLTDILVDWVIESIEFHEGCIMNKNTIGIIGCGNMGSSIARGMKENSALLFESVFLYDKDQKKMEDVAKETGFSQGEISQIVRGSDIIIVAVKPQDFDNLCAEIAADIVDQTVVSVMAGITISYIENKINSKTAIVRAMPNMGALMAKGITAICHNEVLTDISAINDIFSCVGEVVLASEKDFDVITAISGSGPAYLFYLAESMIKAGIDLGVDPVMSKKLVVETLFGAATILKNGKVTPRELIEKVASRGGTTEAALNVFKDRELDRIIIEAIGKAKDRSKELS